MDSQAAQADLRASYVNGGPGAVVSGIVWFAAALTATIAGVAAGFVVLFFGGMTIFPLGTLIVRSVFRRDAPSDQNPGGRIVVETVFPMIGGLFAAWLLLPHRPEAVFPIAAIAVGAHYFGFRSAYGPIGYWVLATIMCVLGVAAVLGGVPHHGTVPYWIAAIEVGFGVWLTWSGLRAGSVVQAQPSGSATSGPS